MATTTTIPVMTFNTAGNIISSGSISASGTANASVDYSSKHEGKIHWKNTPGGTVAATRGLKCETFRRYGSTPTTAESAMAAITLPSATASTAESGDTFVGAGKYNFKLTNLDASNAVTAEVTGDTLDSLQTS